MPLPTRKHIRLKSYDYSAAGMYFITVCIKNRQRLLGEIIKGTDGAKVILSETGKCVVDTICEIPAYSHDYLFECRYRRADTDRLPRDIRPYGGNAFSLTNRRFNEKKGIKDGRIFFMAKIFL